MRRRGGHVVDKNLVGAAGARRSARRRGEFPLAAADLGRVRGDAPARARRGGARLRADQPRRGVAEQALAAGAVRRGRRGRSRERHGLPLGRAVGAGRGGAGGSGRRARRAARRSPRRRRGIGDLLALARGARLIVSGDTGPLHLAAAVGTPRRGAVRPDRPGAQRPVGRRPTSALSRFADCVCHYQRRCRREPRLHRRHHRRGRAWSHRPTSGRRRLAMPEPVLRARSRACACRSGSSAASPRSGSPTRRGARWPSGVAVAVVGRGDSRLGGGPPREGAGGHQVGPVPLHGPPALPRLVAASALGIRRRRRAASIVACWRRAYLGADAGGGDPERGSRACGRSSGASTRSTAAGAGAAAAVAALQPGAGVAQPRAPGGGRRAGGDRFCSR